MLREDLFLNAGNSQMINHSENYAEDKKKRNKSWPSVPYNESVMISLIYAVFGVLWILLSDNFLEYIIPDIGRYKHFQTYKGWFYILITTLMLYLLIRRRMRLLKQENRKTVIAYEKLRLAHEELIATKSELDYQILLTDSIINEAPVFIVTHDENRIISHNPLAQKISGYTREELNEKNWIELLVPEEYRDAVRKIYKKIREERKSYNYEFPIITKDGTAVNVLWNSNLLSHNSDTKDSCFVTFGTDINERKRYEEKVKQLAFFDTLTGLPNRTMFENEINKYLSLNRPDTNFMIAYIDIDNFKNINDSMGHQVGDLFLTYLGERLKAEAHESDFIARLGGDEFAILFLRTSRDEVIRKINAIMQRVNRTWTIENHQFYISMSVGVVEYPSDGNTTTTLLKNADIAMYSAKREGKNRVLFYKEDISVDIAQHLKMINDLQYGIDGEQFVLYYQPQYSLESGNIIGAEALVRWVHPGEGFIPPGEFIPLAEESGQIYRLERWIMANALRQKKEWEDRGFRELVMSINLSGKTLTSNINFKEIEQIIAKNRVDYSGVVIEVTETASISDVGIVINHLNILRKWGIKIALDDFGTGYSSLNYLKMFPINIIKLDRSFINAINENGIDTLLIRNILSLARDLQFEVVAEGIETREQLEFLKKYFCEIGQGYLFSRPLPIERLYALLDGQEKYGNP
jgi:diguanylate cyclase (GGDEF)-like protein/PAS domain S-box-containing protein